ncbi:MAG: DUF3267 domain-containing protein, partial [Oscillospiraceae bacterium]
MATMHLPENYKLKKQINLQKDVKLMIFINLGALLVCIPLIVIGIFMSPIELSLSSITGTGLLKLFVAVIGMIAYLFLHELVHGFFIKRYCGENAEYGFTGIYAFAGKKTAYFCKKEYLIIALSPVVVWGLVLLILNFIVPPDWFWVVY